MPKSNTTKRRSAIQRKNKGTAKPSTEPSTSINTEVPSFVDIEALQREVAELRRRNSELSSSNTEQPSTDSTETAFFLGIGNPSRQINPSIASLYHINYSK